jgi:hypothetical protein
MTDKQLFAATFKRGVLRDSWKSWRVFLAALFGLAMDDEARKIFTKHTGRTDLPEQPFNEACVIAGRRAGKSIVSALVATFLVAFKDYSSVLAPGEVGVLMIISADRRQARTIFGYVSALFETPLLAKLVLRKTRDAIELSNFTRIEIHTCSFKATRGYTCIGVVADEVAFWRSEDSANPDVEVLNALRPSVATTGGLLLFISSPYSKRGAVYDAFRRHYGKPSDVLVWKSSSRDMNPSLSAAVVALVHDPQAAKAEFGGEFRDDLETFLPLEIVEACVVRDRRELPPMDGVTYHGFCDPSGGAGDSMTLAISHSSGLDSSQRVTLDLLRERVSPFDPEQVTREFAADLKRFRCYSVTGDHYSAGWVRESFARQGLEYRPSDKTRSELYAESLPLFMTRALELLDSRKLVAQFASLERRTGRGRDAIDHPVGAHDDAANAVAGSVVLAAAEAGGVLGLVEYIKQGGSSFVLDLDAPKPKAITTVFKPDDLFSCGSNYPPAPAPKAKVYESTVCPFCKTDLTAVNAETNLAHCAPCNRQVQLHEKSPYAPSVGQNRGEYLQSGGQPLRFGRTTSRFAWKKGGGR